MIDSLTSFRDPAGSCCLIDQRVLRFVNPKEAVEFEAFLKTPSAQACAAKRQIVGTHRLGETELAAIKGSSQLPSFRQENPATQVFEHELVRFPSYPYEWPAEMLWEAGRLTLDLAIGMLEDGYSLKD